MEYLVRSLAALHGYITFLTGEHGQAAQCAVFQAFCTECSKEIPAEGPSVTFRTPSANPGEAVTYLTTVHMGECSTKVQNRILKSMKEPEPIDVPCDHCGARPMEPCNYDCLSQY